MFESAVRLTHLAFTIPLLFVPIPQFSKSLRSARPNLHRALGRAYLVSAKLAAIGALYPGLSFEQHGRRFPLVLFASLWFYFSLSAWQAARRKDFQTHAKFVVRSYGVALAFVIVRILGHLEPYLFAWIPEAAARGVTREWLAFIIPLLLIGLTMSWAPSMRAGSEKASLHPDRSD